MPSDAHPAPGLPAPPWREALLPAVLAVLLGGGAFVLWGDVGLSLRDEGYLWYGVLGVLRGELPLRDFQAYDPGRYLWCAVFSPVFGDGLLGVRAASAVFGALGLFLGLCAVRRVVRCPWLLSGNALLLHLWMFPRHKLFESALTLAGTWVAVRLLESPSARRHAVAGAFVGLAAFFGRNHGLYAGTGFALLILYMQLKLRAPDLARRLGAFAGGVVLGSLPLLALFLAPGYLRGFLEATRLLLEQGANIPAAYPWPWRAAFAGREVLGVLGELGRMLAFLLPVLVLPTALVVAWRTGRDELGARALILAGLFLGLPYVHHYAIRSDLSHLAQGIGPLLLAAIALPTALARAKRARARLLVLGGLALVTLLVTLARHPALRFLHESERVELVAHRVGADTLRLRFPLARHLGRVESLVEKYVAPEEALFIAPTSPTYYPLLGKRSPDWWIYYLWPASEELQRETIRRIEEAEVPFALIVERSFDADASYAFAETNPLVSRHLEETYMRIEDPLVPPQYTLYRRGR